MDIFYNVTLTIQQPNHVVLDLISLFSTFASDVEKFFCTPDKIYSFR